jgi:ribose 5-phosphate isomerase B
MRFAIGSDARTHLTDVVVADLADGGHETVLFGALRELGVAPEATWDWPLVSRQVAESVSGGECQEGILFCWTGTGASIAANKAPGVRAALCGDAETARGARVWNHANVLVLSLRSTAEAVAKEILATWLATPWSDDAWNLRQLASIREMEQQYGRCAEGACGENTCPSLHRL